jgi:hypothetical protein
LRAQLQTASVRKIGDDLRSPAHSQKTEPTAIWFYSVRRPVLRLLPNKEEGENFPCGKHEIAQQ